MDEAPLKKCIHCMKGTTEETDPEDKSRSAN